MNLDQIFSEMENAVELSSDLVFLKKGKPRLIPHDKAIELFGF